VAAGLLLEFLLAALQEDGGVGFAQEDEACGCVDGADDCQRPEDPTPVCALDDYAAEESALSSLLACLYEIRMESDCPRLTNVGPSSGPSKYHPNTPAL